MPALVELDLEVTRLPRRGLPYYLHGAVHAMLGGKDSPLGRAVHGSGGGANKPLALSWVGADAETAAAWMGQAGAVRPWERLQGAGEGPHLVCQLRLLDEGLAPEVLGRLRGLAGEAFAGESPEGLAGVVRGAEGKPCPSYAEIWARADADAAPEEVELEFVSPATVSASGRSWPLPIPRYLWNGLERRWNAFSPRPFDLRGWWERHLVCTGYKTPIREYPSSRRAGLEAGFTGRARFGFLGGAGAHERRQTAALAAFAEYAGVGENRAFGWGVVRATLHPPKSP